MPCNSDYLDPSHYERALSQVACLLDELNGKPEIDPDHWRGYHPKIYNRVFDGNSLVSELCARLQSEDVSTRSLEMQIWWRDHLKADKARIKRELAEVKTERERAAALKKLTPHERKLLGLD